MLRIADGYRNLLPGMFSHPPFSKDSIDGAGLREREREMFAGKDDLSGMRKWAKYSTCYLLLE